MHWAATSVSAPAGRRPGNLRGRMEQGYQPGEGGGWCGCLGFLLALVVVVTVFSFIAGLGMDLVHLFH